MLCLRTVAVFLLSSQLGFDPTTNAAASDHEEAGSITPMRRVLGAIFADQHVDDAAIDVHRFALTMPPEQRFEYLANWVLPGSDHETFRLAVDFSPTHPAPPARNTLEEQ